MDLFGRALNLRMTSEPIIFTTSKNHDSPVRDFSGYGVTTNSVSNAQSSTKSVIISVEAHDAVSASSGGGSPSNTNRIHP
jgi:hypothetical protein